MFLWKCKSFWDKNVSSWEGLEPSTFGCMATALTTWAIRVRNLLSMFFSTGSGQSFITTRGLFSIRSVEIDICWYSNLLSAHNICVINYWTHIVTSLTSWGAAGGNVASSLGEKAFLQSWPKWYNASFKLSNLAWVSSLFLFHQPRKNVKTVMSTLTKTNLRVSLTQGYFCGTG